MVLFIHDVRIYIKKVKIAAEKKTVTLTVCTNKTLVRDVVDPEVYFLNSCLPFNKIACKESRRPISLLTIHF